jgi:response regulator RpfG family c-di-GMP phosphodiesterase
MESDVTRNDDELPMASSRAGSEVILPHPSPRILVVDDEQSTRSAEMFLLTRKGYSCDAAASVAEAWELFRANTYDVAFIDFLLPDGTGLDLLRLFGRREPRPICIVVTGETEVGTAISAIREGAHDYIAKPFGVAMFYERLEKAVDAWRAQARTHLYQNQLEALLDDIGDQLRQSEAELERTYDMTVAALGAALDLRDPETEEHCRRVSANSVLLGSSLGMSGVVLRTLKWGSYLHDIGKIGIPEHILGKPSSLTKEEMAVVRTHPTLGYRMISAIGFLAAAAEVVLYHHEKYDGSGYPEGLRGDSIPLGARIFALVDTMDAMMFDRPYRKALPYSAVIEEITSLAGRHFDPQLVEHFAGIPQDAWQSGGGAQR